MEKKIYALGFFDGVHLGHQALLRACVELARENGCRSAALSFDRPPAAVLRGRPVELLTSPYDRSLLLRRYGIDTVELYPANAQTLSRTWREFVDELLLRGAAGFVCGYDYRFGRDGAGDAQMLASFADAQGLPCVIVPQQCLDGEKISSTRIRDALLRGDLADANRLLGHPHMLTGKVVSGQHIGRTIGVPTANLQACEDVLCPAHGVYACRAHLEDRVFRAVTNVGIRPTVGGKDVTIEPWLLDFDGDLYGRTLTLEFCRFLRAEQKFPTLDALQRQIHLDAATTAQCVPL